MQAASRHHCLLLLGRVGRGEGQEGARELDF